MRLSSRGLRRVELAQQAPSRPRSRCPQQNTPVAPATKRRSVTLTYGSTRGLAHAIGRATAAGHPEGPFPCAKLGETRGGSRAARFACHATVSADGFHEGGSSAATRV